MAAPASPPAGCIELGADTLIQFARRGEEVHPWHATKTPASRLGFVFDCPHPMTRRADTGGGQGNHSISRIILRECRIKSWSCQRSSMA
jgi:hypothetical protein